jgi:hypothetical protein
MTRKTLTACVWAGIALQVAAGFVWALTLAPGQSDGGAVLGVLGTVALSGAGTSLLFVGLVGWAVLLGLRAHGEEVGAQAARTAAADAHSARLRG